MIKFTKKGRIGVWECGSKVREKSIMKEGKKGKGTTGSCPNKYSVL